MVAFVLLSVLARLDRIVPGIFSNAHRSIEDFARWDSKDRYRRVEMILVGMAVLARDVDDEATRDAVLVDELQQIDVFDFAGLECSI